MRHEIEVKMIEIKKTAALTSATPEVKQRSEVILSDLDLQSRIDKAIATLELFSSNLMDEHSLQEPGFTDNIQQRLQVRVAQIYNWTIYYNCHEN